MICRLLLALSRRDERCQYCCLSRAPPHLHIVCVIYYCVYAYIQTYCCLRTYSIHVLHFVYCTFLHPILLHELWPVTVRKGILTAAIALRCDAASAASSGHFLDHSNSRITPSYFYQNCAQQFLTRAIYGYGLSKAH